VENTEKIATLGTQDKGGRQPKQTKNHNTWGS